MRHNYANNTNDADINFSGIDFDDREFGFKEEDKSSTKVWTMVVVSGSPLTSSSKAMRLS